MIRALNNSRGALPDRDVVVFGGVVFSGAQYGTGISTVVNHRDHPDGLRAATLQRECHIGQRQFLVA